MKKTSIQKMETTLKKQINQINIKQKKIEKYFRNFFLILLLTLLSLLFFDLIEYFINNSEYPWGYEDGGWAYENPTNYLIVQILIILYLLSLIFLLLMRYYKTFIILVFTCLFYLIIF